MTADGFRALLAAALMFSGTCRGQESAALGPLASANDIVVSGTIYGRYDFAIYGYEHNWVVLHPGFTLCSPYRTFCEWVELPGPKVLR